jgi:hypothetical protein
LRPAELFAVYLLQFRARWADFALLPQHRQFRSFANPSQSGAFAVLVIASAPWHGFCFLKKQLTSRNLAARTAKFDFSIQRT